MRGSGSPASTPAPMDADHGRFLFLVGAILYLALWIWPMRSSLWTDELGTWWIVKDGLGDAIARSFEYHGPPAFYVVAWVAKELGGRQEAALRLPALAAATAAILVFFRLVQRLSDTRSAQAASVAFVGLGGIAFAATDARPYGVGLLTVVGATLALVRWLDDGEARWGALFVISAIATVWLHYMLALILPVHLIYAIFRLRARSTPVRLRGLLAAGAAIGLGMVPLLAQLVSLWGRRGSLAVPNVAAVADLFGALLPLSLVAGLAVGVIVARAVGPLSFSASARRSDGGALLICWLVLPVVTLFSLSALTGVMFFAPRYYLVSAPAAAAIFGWTCASIRPASASRVTIAVFAIVAVLLGGGMLKNGEDWRGAIAFTRTVSDASTVVLVHPGFVESAQLSWLEDPERRDYLMSPLSFYELGGEVVPLPYVLDPPAEAYLDRVVNDQLADVDRFLIVTNYADVPYASWLNGRLGPAGWHSQVRGSFGVIQVIEFTKEGVEPG